MRNEDLTPVELKALEASPFAPIYAPTERIKTIVVENFPALGKLAAMRFVEWVQTHSGGVIALPTGKTPEHFIKWVTYLLGHWEEPEARRQLERSGVDPAHRPDMGSLHFVQIDEFYPIQPWQHNSFFYYVNQFYLQGFGLDLDKALLIDSSQIGLGPGQDLDSVWPNHEVDLGLRYRHGANPTEVRQKIVLEKVDEWCQEYEDKIRALGGIGFFLGGIGPDGHIGFNVQGSDHHSTTRLTPTNYETQAAAATDLGGIEISRRRPVITIGLGTITYNPDCAAIIIAAGAAKAGVVAGAVQHAPQVLYPATALQALPQARFYLTRGAAKQLTERQLVLVDQAATMSDEEMEKTIIDLAVQRRKRVLDLTAEELAADRFTAAMLGKRPEPVVELLRLVRESLVRKVEKGTQSLSNTHFFHTEPHHDDILLGYLPYVVRHIRSATNSHHFICLTSGFTSVTNHFMQHQLSRLYKCIDSPEYMALMEEGYFEPDHWMGSNRDVWLYLDGVAAASTALKDNGAARRLLRNLIDVYGERDLARVKQRIAELEHYFATSYPGKKDPDDVQRLKGMRREWEEECLWGYFGWNCDHVRHLRLGFYTGDIFTEEPTVERDVLPVLAMLRKVQPQVVTVALDPEASGPDTHYKALQVVTEALKHYEQETGPNTTGSNTAGSETTSPKTTGSNTNSLSLDGRGQGEGGSGITVIGYRNVWYRFHPAEANLYVPVSLNMFSVLESAFMNAFISQKNASFPSYEHDGPFNQLAQKIQVEQYEKIKICLGREWFYEHPSALVRATRGLVFLKEMQLADFYQLSRALKYAVESK